MTPPRAERGRFRDVWTPAMDRVALRSVKLRRQLSNKRVAVRLNVSVEALKARLALLGRRK